jgi:hypothetical protein
MIQLKRVYEKPSRDDGLRGPGGTAVAARLDRGPGARRLAGLMPARFLARKEGEGGYNEDYEYFGELANI